MGVTPGGSQGGEQGGNQGENQEGSDETSVSAPTKTVNGHGFVDLGLPSGLHWAACNVGADAPEKDGGHFAWGETAAKSGASYWENYKWCGGAKDNLTKYCVEATAGKDGLADGKTVLEAADDAATANWGAPCRVPTKDEFAELHDNCDWSWTTLKGVKGYKATSKANGNSVFFPAAGGYTKSGLSGTGKNGHYWLATLYEKHSYGAYEFRFGESDAPGAYGLNRCFGLSVRAVTE